MTHSLVLSRSRCDVPPCPPMASDPGLAARIESYCYGLCLGPGSARAERGEPTLPGRVMLRPGESSSLN